MQLPGFTFRQGLTQWKVLTEKLKPQGEADYFQEFNSFEDVPADYHKLRCLKETMFQSHYSLEILAQLPRCLRVLPHDQNTSGFFITIIRKVKDFDNPAEEQKQVPTEEATAPTTLARKLPLEI